VLDYPPSTVGQLSRCQPIYEELPGWEAPTNDCRTFSQLPHNAQGYVRRVEKLLECPVDLVSVGAVRDEAITIRPIL